MLFSEMISFQVFLVQIKRRVLGTTIILFFFLASNMMISIVLVGNTQVSAGACCSWFMRVRLHSMKTGLKCLTLSLAPCHHFVPQLRKLYICLSLPKFLISRGNTCLGYPWQRVGLGTPIYGPILTGTCCCRVSVNFFGLIFVVSLNLIVLEKLIK